MSDEPWLTNGQAAREVGLGHSTLTLYIRDGRLTPTTTTPGGQARWKLGDLRTQLEALRLEAQAHRDHERRREAEQRRRLDADRSRRPDHGR